MKKTFLLLLLLLGAQSLKAVDVVEVNFPDSKNLETEWLGNIFGINPGDTFSTVSIEQGLERLYSSGFFVEKPTSETITNDGNVIINIRFKEFPIIESIVLEGIEWIDPLMVLNSITVKEGFILNTNELMESYRIIKAKYAESGYPWIFNESESLNWESKTLTIKFIEPLFGDVVFEGLMNTNPDALKRFLWMEKGDPITYSAIQLELKDLYGTKLFSSVPEVRIQLPEKDENLPYFDIVYSLTEAEKTANLLFGAFYGDTSGLGGYISYREDNFRGNAVSLGTTLSYGDRGSSYDVSYKDDSYKDTRLSLSSRIFDTDRNIIFYEEPTDPNYNFASKGGEISLGKRVDRMTRLDFTLHSSENDYALDSGDDICTSNPTVDCGDLLAEKGILRGDLNSISLGYTKDTRFNPFDPTDDATYYSFSIEHGFDSSEESFGFTKYSYDLRKYKQLKNPEFLLAGRYKVGKIDGDAPSTRRFWTGGSSSLRGYDLGEQKGNYQSLLNLELRWHKEDTPWSAALFADYGSSSNESSALSFENAMMSYGVGVRFSIGFFGIAPVRFDLAFSPDLDDTKFHFSVGHMF